MVQIKLAAVLFAALSIPPFAVVGAPTRSFYDRNDLEFIDSSLVRRAWSTLYGARCKRWSSINADPCGQPTNCGCSGQGLSSCHDQTMLQQCKYTRECGCIKIPRPVHNPAPVHAARPARS